MLVAIVGAGAMGCLFGGLLKDSGQDVILIDVWREHVHAINDAGLILENDNFKKIIYVPAFLPEDVKVTPDLLIIFTKSFQTEVALKGIEKNLSDQVYVLTLQNGLGHVDLIEKTIDRGKIIHGITTYPCDIVGPGRIRTKGEGIIRMMSVDGKRHQMLERVEALLNSAGLNCEITPDVEIAIWEKVAFNAAMNALTAILRLPVGALGESAQGRRLAKNTVDEVVTIAHGKGIPADSQRIGATLEMAFRAHKEHLPSMLQDVVNKKKTEIDFINGAVIKEAKKLGIAAPVNETLYGLIKTIESVYL